MRPISRPVLMLTLLVLGAVVAGVASMTTAAPARAAAMPTTFGPPRETAKVILSDTSVDGPALWTSPSGTVRSVIAWTGTDSAHHLNVMYSRDGLRYADKRVLHETSAFRPAVVAVSADANPTLIMAWVGTDANHSLNVFSGIPGYGYEKLTLRDNSFTAPALAINGGTVYLVWAGTDANHSLNVLPILWRGGLATGTKSILRQFSSVARPSVGFDPTSKQLLMSWITASQRVNFATSADGVSWTVPSSSPLAEWSDVGPAMMGFDTNNMPRYFLAWRGIDAAHSVNVQYTESFPRWPLDDSKTALRERAFGGPAVGFVGVYRQALLAWTGTDAAHHLNVAIIAV